MKKNFLFVLITASCGLLQAQMPSIEWQNTIGGTDYDGLETIKQTADGGYIIGGYSWSGISGDKTENSKGDADYWVVKLGASGNVQWQKTIGGNAYEVLFSVQQTTDGGYFLGGISGSPLSGDKTEDNSGQQDYWVLKLDGNGNIQWQNTIGGNRQDILHSCQQTTDGGYILGGYSNSSISGDKTENSDGDNDPWVVKLDATGNVSWDETINSDGYDYLDFLEQTSDGGYILACSSDGTISGDKTEDSQGEYDYWVIKLDGAGNIAWQNTIGGNTQDLLRSIHQTSDGGYILGGISASEISGDKSEGRLGGAFDYWIIKLDANGAISWQNTIGGDGYDGLSSIYQTIDGGYIVGGSSNSSVSGDKTEGTLGESDYWIVKLNSNGDISWQNTIGGSGPESFRVVQETAGGGYIIGGLSSSNISGEKTENCIGNYDFWVVKLGCSPITYYADSDGDGYGNPSINLTQCLAPNGYVINSGDCNDNNAAVHPGATEICKNGIDDNCDGLLDMKYQPVSITELINAFNAGVTAGTIIDTGNGNLNNFTNALNHALSKAQPPVTPAKLNQVLSKLDDCLKFSDGVGQDWVKASPGNAAALNALRDMILFARENVDCSGVPTPFAPAGGGEISAPTAARADADNSGQMLQLFQNRPNPFSAETAIGFYLPEQMEATLSVFDVTGRLVFQKTAVFGKGENVVTLSETDLNAKGVLAYRLDTLFGSAMKRMVRVE